MERKATERKEPETGKPKKLSYKDQRELEQLPARLKQLEAGINALQEAMSTPEFYQQDSAAITAKQAELEQLADDVSPREQEILDRIAELEGADVPQQQSLIEIRDNELAQLREELARIRGEEASEDPPGE